MALTAAADVLDDARRVVTEGDYWKGEQMLRDAAAANPKITQNAQYNYLLGACKFETGDYPEARRLLTAAKAKGNGASSLYLGRLAFLDYDFDKAAELYGEFKSHRTKQGQVVGETVERLENQLAIAENALERVEKIVVIDSLAVPADGFFKYYKLPKSAGRFVEPTAIADEDHRNGVEMAFVNEGGDFMMWGEPDSIGNVHIVESMKLTDGTWTAPSPTPSFLHKGGYADFPFMMPDGVTLYYAATGDGSMGGYDIFVVTRDATTGEYLQPQNLGMPFNSPHDDFLLAIDEENGVGWWATDRNLLGDKVTLYVFMVNDVRKNYDAEEEEDILSKARLTDYKATQNPDDKEKYDALLAAVEGIQDEKGKDARDFVLPMGDGKFYTKYSDFLTDRAKKLMRQYLTGSVELAQMEADMKALRKRYPVNRADNVRQELIKLERETEKLRAELQTTKSEIYRLERTSK